MALYYRGRAKPRTGNLHVFVVGEGNPAGQAVVNLTTVATNVRNRLLTESLSRPCKS